MNIRHTESFIKNIEKLPKSIKRIFKKQKGVFIKNWLDPRLHIKRMKELPGCFSFRITRRYRVLFYFRNKDAIFFSIGHRKDIYKS